MHIVSLPNMGRLILQISKGAMCHSQSRQTSQSQLMSSVPSHMPSHSFFVSPSAHLFILLSYPSIQVHPSLSCPSELIHPSRSIHLSQEAHKSTCQCVFPHACMHDKLSM